LNGWAWQFGVRCASLTRRCCSTAPCGSLEVEHARCLVLCLGACPACTTRHTPHAVVVSMIAFDLEDGPRLSIVRSKTPEYIPTTPQPHRTSTATLPQARKQAMGNSLRTPEPTYAVLATRALGCVYFLDCGCVGSPACMLGTGSGRPSSLTRDHRPLAACMSSMRHRREAKRDGSGKEWPSSRDPQLFVCMSQHPPPLSNTRTKQTVGTRCGPTRRCWWRRWTTPTTTTARPSERWRGALLLLLYICKHERALWLLWDSHPHVSHTKTRRTATSAPLPSPPTRPAPAPSPRLSA
jgi:hypothetical protein